MHEAAIAKSILDIASRRVSRYLGATVTGVKVRIGAFRNVDPESLRFAFDGLKQTQPALQSAQLTIEPVQAVAACSACGREYQVQESLGYRCDSCGAGMGALIRGDEFDVVGCTLEVDSRGVANARVG